MNVNSLQHRIAGMDQYLRQLRPAAQMVFFATTGCLLISLFWHLLQPAIKAHESDRLWKAIHELCPETVSQSEHLEIVISPSKQPFTIYRLMDQGIFKAWIVETSTLEGYNGEIRFVLALKTDQSLIGIRILRHRETPGIGDFIEIRRSSWLSLFNGKQIDGLSDSAWNIQKDGGRFDQVTGATVTSRAIVRGVHATLKNVAEIFQVPQEH
jgi:electron transport complex protein RnfG